MTVRTPGKPEAARFRAPFLRAWREKFDWSQEHVVARIEEVTDGALTLTAVSLGRIERGLQPYNQEQVEALEKVFGLPAPVLLFRDPGIADADWGLWETMTPEQRATAARIIQAVTLPPAVPESVEVAPVSGARKSTTPR